MRLEAGWFVPEVSTDPVVHRIPTTRTSKLETPKPLAVVWHYTGGVGPNLTRNLSERIQRYDRKVDRPASWHLTIARSGEIYQNAPTTLGTWHVGKPGSVCGKHYANINRCTLGVELENAGRLRKVGNSYYCWPYWQNPDAPPDKRTPDKKFEVIPARAKRVAGVGVFDTFTPEQEKTAVLVLRALVKEYEWDKTACSYGHAEFDSPRKEDPGPVWVRECLPRVLGQVFP